MKLETSLIINYLSSLERSYSFLIYSKLAIL